MKLFREQTHTQTHTQMHRRPHSANNKPAGTVVLFIGDDPLVSTVSGHTQFLALWCPPIGGHPQNFQPRDR